MRTHNLFISHSWSYSGHYDRLVALLSKRAYFSFKNYSVPFDDPIHDAPTDYHLRNAIRQQMLPCGVILMVAGVYSTYSKWINIEIYLAQHGFNQPKPIIAVEPFGARHTSSVVKNAAARIVRWNTESIVKAIRDLD